MRMRVSDEDREQTAQRLQRAFSEGRLTHPELDERLERALTAKTYADLLALIDDLPADEPRVGDVVELQQANGAVKRSGDWAVPRRLRAGSKYGTVDLDFSDAVIPHQVVEIELDLQYGNARITVPEGAVANIDGFESTWGRHADRRRAEQATARRPLLRDHRPGEVRRAHRALSAQALVHPLMEERDVVLAGHEHAAVPVGP
ncbi:hypothetical protein GCM10020001_025210 [Nonomuraea salmonea]